MFAFISPGLSTIFVKEKKCPRNRKREAIKENESLDGNKQVLAISP
jgi:hypothetical protein